MLPKVRIGLLCRLIPLSCCLIPAVTAIAQTGAPSWGYYYPGPPPVYPGYPPYGYPPPPLAPAAQPAREVAKRPASVEPKAGSGATDGRAESSPAPAALPGAFRLEASRLGQVLANARSLTLYRALREGEDAARCPDPCASLWQPFLLADSDRPAAPFGAVQRADGARQWSYAGHPLYLWRGDQHAGDVTGDGVDGLWQAVRIAPE